MEDGMSVKHSQQITANSTVDPTTVENLLTMCFGALTTLNETVVDLYARIRPILQENDQVMPSGDAPEANCELGARIVELYMDITRINRNLTEMRYSVRL